MPTLFSPNEANFIPQPLLGHTHYVLDSERNYAKLLAYFVGRAGVSPGPLGPLREISQIGVEPLRFDSKEKGQAMGKLHGAPDLPPHYLPREDELVELKEKLLADVRNVAITGRGQAVGVQGMGGIGKTVLAAALAQNSEVRRAFLDGIYRVLTTSARKPPLRTDKFAAFWRIAAPVHPIRISNCAESGYCELIRHRKGLTSNSEAGQRAETAWAKRQKHNLCLKKQGPDQIGVKISFKFKCSDLRT